MIPNGIDMSALDRSFSPLQAVYKRGEVLRSNHFTAGIRAQ